MNKLPGLLNWFNRVKITLLTASLVLVLGAIFPWYHLPPQALETFHTNLSFANLGRLLAAMFVILNLAFIFWLSISCAWRLILLTGLITVFLFPYFVTTRSPCVAFIASAYYNQGQAVSNHIDTNFSQVQAQWKQNISLNQPSVPPTTFEMSIQNSLFFQMPSWNQIILDGFGYKNSFFEFIGMGWSFSLIGMILSLIGLYLGIEQKPEERMSRHHLQHSYSLPEVFVVENQGINAFMKDMNLFLPGTLLFLFLILFSIITVNLVNYNLDTQFAKGEYDQVVNISKTLTLWYPPLQGDVAFLERLGRAEFYTGKPELALINFVKGLESYRIGDFQSAENYFQSSLDIQDNFFLARGYLSSANLNQGVNYLNNPNNRNPGSAVDIFEITLRIFPGHVEALYDLMLASVVNGEFQKSADVAKEIIIEQQYFQQQRIGLMGQAYLHLSWAEYNNGDFNKTWERYRQSVDYKSWKKSLVEEQK